MRHFMDSKIIEIRFNNYKFKNLGVKWSNYKITLC